MENPTNFDANNMIAKIYESISALMAARESELRNVLDKLIKVNKVDGLITHDISNLLTLNLIISKIEDLLLGSPTELELSPINIPMIAVLSNKEIDELNNSFPITRNPTLNSFKLGCQSLEIFRVDPIIEVTLSRLSMSEKIFQFSKVIDNINLAISQLGDQYIKDTLILLNNAIGHQLLMSLPLLQRTNVRDQLFHNILIPFDNLMREERILESVELNRIFSKVIFENLVKENRKKNIFRIYDYGAYSRVDVITGIFANILKDIFIENEVGTPISLGNVDLFNQIDLIGEEFAPPTYVSKVKLLGNSESTFRPEEILTRVQDLISDIYSLLQISEDTKAVSIIVDMVFPINGRDMRSLEEIKDRYLDPIFASLSGRILEEFKGLSVLVRYIPGLEAILPWFINVDVGFRKNDLATAFRGLIFKENKMAEAMFVESFRKKIEIEQNSRIKNYLEKFLEKENKTTEKKK